MSQSAGDPAQRAESEPVIRELRESITELEAQLKEDGHIDALERLQEADQELQSLEHEVLQ